MLNIITPCSRPENLRTIERYIKIPKPNFRWIIVFDAHAIPNVYIPKIAEAYAHKQEKSVVGHAQRNFAMDIVDKGYIYFNDDDTIVQPALWPNIEDYLGEYDFISFDQANKDRSMRLIGSTVQANRIDSHNFIVSYEISKNIRWHIDRYNADGFFAEDCYKVASKKLYINKTLSVYNLLR